MSIPGAASPLFIGAAAGAAAGYQIDRSLRFNDGDSAFLNRTPSTSGNKIIWTFSFWIKLNKVDGQRQILTSYVDSSNDSLIKINSNGYLEIYNYRSGAYKTQYISNARFRDHSAWYHFVISCNGNTSLSTWVNGVAITFSTSTGPDGTDWLFNGTNSHQIGRYNTTANSDFQLAETQWIDGQALAASDFGEFDLNNAWQPKEYSGTYGPLVDQSQTWTSQVSGTGNSTYPFSNVFNNDGQATHAYPANGTEAVFTPSPSFSSATTVKIWYYAPTLHANAFKLNGTGVGNSLSTTSGTNTHTFDVTGTGFTSLSWSKGVYGSEDTGLLRIDVDGKQLVDSTVAVGNN